LTKRKRRTFTEEFIEQIVVLHTSRKLTSEIIN